MGLYRRPKVAKVIFNGHFSEQEAIQVIVKLNLELANSMQEGEKADIIWNCLSMKGYDTAARTQWQVFMKKNKSRINYIWIITTDKILYTIAKTMALLTNYKLKVASSEEDIKHYYKSVLQ